MTSSDSLAAETSLPLPPDSFSFFEQVSEIIVQISKAGATGTELTPDEQGRAVAANLSALTARIQATYDAVKALPRINQTEDELRMLLAKFQDQLAKKLEPTNNSVDDPMNDLWRDA
eukprot:jgi/Hompol1/1625/HPOL_005667-RA